MERIEEIKKVQERIEKVESELASLENDLEENRESDFVDEDYYTADIAMKEVELNLLRWILSDVLKVKQ